MLQHCFAVKLQKGFVDDEADWTVPLKLRHASSTRLNFISNIVFQITDPLNLSEHNTHTWRLDGGYFTYCTPVNTPLNCCLFLSSFLQICDASKTSVSLTNARYVTSSKQRVFKGVQSSCGFFVCLCVFSLVHECTNKSL